jgi:iron complex transport system substrate-binding protein
VRALIDMIAVAVEEPAAGRRLIVEMDARLAATRPETAARPSALIYQVNNYVTGSGSLFDEALDRAGFRNAGRDVTRLASGRTSLEFIVATPPDVIVLASKPEAYATVVGDNLRHPALTQRLAQTPNIVLPWPLSLCGTHHIATAVETLAAARKALLAAPKAGP